MATAVVSAVFSVVGKALAPLTDGLLKEWAATVELGSNVDDLEHELKLVKALLEPTVAREIDNSSLKELLAELKELGYDADDVLDELDYFRIQDELDGTFHATDEHPKGCTHNLALNVCHAAKAVGKQIWLPACFSSANITSGTKANQGVNRGQAKLNSRSCCNPINAVGKCFQSSPLPSDLDNDDDDDDSGRMINSLERNIADETPKLTFNRVDTSIRMQHITKQLQRVREGVSNSITTLGYNWSTTVPQNIARSHRITTSESIEPKLYGRDLVKNTIIHDITKGKHSSDVLTVIPIVGPGGIGKTTLAQHIHHSPEVEKHFDVRVWTCVSLNFNVNKLIEEIEKRIPKDAGESSNGRTAGELIGQRLKNKRLLLVLDDIWDCSDDDEWKRLLVPFRKSQVHGNIIIVTTRFPAQAQIMVGKNNQSIYLQGLENKEFKELFLEIIFGDDDQSRKDHEFLLETGDKIVDKLKGSPLAAKTVGRLLKTELDLDHWKRVLESKEWEKIDGKNDIMPALKLSYDYLKPSQVQQCFSYCALFPQDYKIKREELINFWIGLDVLHSSFGENKKLEDIGQSHLTELVSHGFIEKEGKEDGSVCYFIHDLLHELAWKVSSNECLSIRSSQVRSLQIQPSIRHLSISIDDTSVQNRLTIKNCVEDFRTLDKRIKVEKLRSLMLFGKHHTFFLNTFGDLFSQAKALRVVLLTDAHYGVEDLLHSFYNLFHLRYLRIQRCYLPRTRFSRFYHLVVLDAKGSYINGDLQRNMSNLLKLRHFLVENDHFLVEKYHFLHYRIIEVGKLKSLQELRQFVVKQENEGFELSQIGKLEQLCGSLCIDNLENVRVKQEADEAKLLQKSHLHELILRWTLGRPTSDSTLEEHVIERLKPSSNLRRLSIIGHGGAACPSWLGENLSFKKLESLCLDGVAWKTFPPIGDLWLVNVPQEDTVLNIPDIRFVYLRRLELVNLPRLKTWALQLFPYLEVLIIKGCSQLEDLSISHSTCCQQDLFPRLSKLNIQDCQQLMSFPPVPWTKASCSTLIEGIGSSCIHKLVFGKNRRSEYILKIVGMHNTDRMFWNVLAFHNLSKLKEIEMEGCQPMPLHCLQMLSSLRTLTVNCVGNEFPFVEGGIHMEYQFPVESMLIRRCGATGKELTQLLTYFPKLSQLKLSHCEMITGLLLLPPQLQELDIYRSPELRVHLNPLDNNNGEGFQFPSSLRRLTIWDCPKLLTSYSNPSFSSYFPFPNSLEYLELRGKVGMEVPVPLSNLNSLTSIFIDRCGDLRGEGLLHLLTQGHLTELTVLDTPNFFVDSELPQVHEQRSSRLQHLWMGDVAAFTAMPSLLFSSLTALLLADEEVERFTEEQEALLFVNSLEEIRFMSCKSLRHLPARLGTLPNLKRLYFLGCKAIKMLPEECLPSSLQELYIDNLDIQSLPEGLPTSLQELDISDCPEIRSLPDGLPCSLQELAIQDCAGIQSLPKDGLPNSLQRLCIVRCPAISSLPKVDELPSSLRNLTYEQGREELRRQCLKLKRIIPIVKARDMRHLGDQI